jgi:hypothetical protein
MRTLPAKAAWCPKHQCALVLKPWMARENARLQPLVCLACIAECKARVAEVTLFKRYTPEPKEGSEQ